MKTGLDLLQPPARLRCVSFALARPVCTGVAKHWNHALVSVHRSQTLSTLNQIIKFRLIIYVPMAFKVLADALVVGQ